VANFLAILDPDPDRRQRTVAAAREQLVIAQGTAVGELTADDFQVVWSALPAAPVSVHREGGAGAVVWGEPLQDEPEPLDAAAIFARWRRLPADPGSYDGFYAAVGRHGDHGLVAQADLLGLFPIYHMAAADAVLVATSPTLIRQHEGAGTELDLEGLAGILLTGGPCGGRTVWSGIRRLAPGHVLLADRGRSLEIHHYTPPVSDALHAVPFQEQLEAMDEAVRRALARQARGRETVLLLSGGRDSRLVAGALDALGNPMSTLTLGRPWDNEAYCARPVARTLGVSHRLEDVSPESYPTLARQWARWEHLVGNVSGLDTWSLPYLLPGDGRLVVSGLLLEGAVGGTHVEWSRDARLPAGGEAFLEAVARHAIPASRLRKLVRPALRCLVEDVWGSVVGGFRASADDDWSRAQLFMYSHIRRFHAGAVAWRSSFGAWPVLPILDRDLLALGGALPVSSVGDRRAHDALLATRYRRLARLPLERHSGDRTPLLPSVPRQAWAKAAHHVPVLRRISPNRRIVSYAWRMYDPDRPAWRAVRRMAEPYRGRVLDIFERHTLEAYVPPPDRDMALADPVAEGFGPRHLLGLMLWAGAHRSDGPDPQGGSP